jgi:hypothetical protein
MESNGRRKLAVAGVPLGDGDPEDVPASRHKVFIVDHA